MYETLAVRTASKIFVFAVEIDDGKLPDRKYHVQTLDTRQSALFFMDTKNIRLKGKFFIQ